VSGVAPCALPLPPAPAPTLLLGRRIVTRVMVLCALGVVLVAHDHRLQRLALACRADCSRIVVVASLDLGDRVFEGGGVVGGRLYLAGLVVYGGVGVGALHAALTSVVIRIVRIRIRFWLRSPCALNCILQINLLRSAFG